MCAAFFENDDDARPSSSQADGDLSKSLQIYLEKIKDPSREPAKLSDGNFSVFSFLKVDDIVFFFNASFSTNGKGRFFIYNFLVYKS